MVANVVSLGREQAQVVKRAVQLVTILMVDNLNSSQISAKMLLHHKPVLKHIAKLVA